MRTNQYHQFHPMMLSLKGLQLISPWIPCNSLHWICPKGNHQEQLVSHHRTWEVTLRCQQQRLNVWTPFSRSPVALQEFFWIFAQAAIDPSPRPFWHREEMFAQWIFYSARTTTYSTMLSIWNYCAWQPQDALPMLPVLQVAMSTACSN